MSKGVKHVQFPRGVKQCVKEPEALAKGLKKTALQLNARTSLQKLKADSKISEQRAAQGLLCRILSVYKMKHPSILVIDC